MVQASFGKFIAHFDSADFLVVEVRPARGTVLAVEVSMRRFLRSSLDRESPREKSCNWWLDIPCFIIFIEVLGASSNLLVVDFAPTEKKNLLVSNILWQFTSLPWKFW